MRKKLEDTYSRQAAHSAFHSQVNNTVNEQLDDSLGGFNETSVNSGVEYAFLSEPCRRASGLMTFDNVIESQLALGRIANLSKITLPPSPKPELGMLSSQPVVSEIPPPFDTYFVEEVSGSSSDDDDLFIPPTPQAKRLKPE